MVTDDLKEVKPILRNLFNSQRFAVLATHDEGQPYVNLTAFVATGDLKQLVFATDRDTRKYANLTSDSRTALLIDTRSNQDSDVHNAIAVTAIGKAEEIEETERNGFLKLYLAKHPYLEDFVRSPSIPMIPKCLATPWLKSSGFIEGKLGFFQDEIRFLILQGIQATWLSEDRKRQLVEAFRSDPAWQG
jgi:hypothetical protein